jgi:hypothetical protein
VAEAGEYILRGAAERGLRRGIELVEGAHGGGTGRKRVVSAERIE